MTVNKHIRTGAPGNARRASRKDSNWVLRLYVAGRTGRAVAALGNLKAVCRKRLKGRYRINVIDLRKHPILARDKEIVAVPMLVRTHPMPVKYIIGDLSETDRLLAGLELVESARPPDRHG